MPMHMKVHEQFYLMGFLRTTSISTGLQLVIIWKVIPVEIICQIVMVEDAEGGSTWKPFAGQIWPAGKALRVSVLG